MSIIGASTGITAGPASVAALRAVGGSDRTATPQSAVQTATVAPAAPSEAGFAAAAVTSTALDVGAVPIDQARVASIKKAITTHSYPLIPARIGDAMIAAGMLLRMSK